MSNTELVNAYFDGQLSEVEQEQLLKNLDTDAKLKEEFELQSDIIEGLKNARKAELKARLDNVTIGSGVSSGLTLGQVAAAGGVILLAGTLFYFSSTEPNEQGLEVSPKEVTEDVADLVSAIEDKSSSNQELVTEENKLATEDSKETIEEVQAQEKEAPEINKPIAIEPIEIIEDDDNDTFLPEESASNVENTAYSPVEVSIDNNKRRYSFHYQMKEGKLFLYGDFEKTLYEILEFNSAGGKILYLFYKDKFYNLDRKQESITELSEITQPELLKSLKEARDK